MPTWITAVLAFAAGWTLCTLYHAILCWLDRIFAAPPAVPARAILAAGPRAIVDECEDMYPLQEWATREVACG